MDRRQAILEIIAEELVEDQATLVMRLREKYGIETHQVQVSRDLRHLGVGKKKNGNKMVYEVPENNQIGELLRLSVSQVLHNESMIVVKTRPGLADFVGDYLDLREDCGILATLAGENVVFISPVSVANISKTYRDVCKALSYKHEVET
jgi:transcriptional regulator of arginine metabolism